MTDLPVVFVVAVAENGVIGSRGELPWRLKGDLRKFRSLTMGKPMVMGRRTFESIGRVLDGRDSIVMTRRGEIGLQGVLTANGLPEALRIAAERARLRDAKEICIIGGEAVFRDAMPLATRLHVTHVAASPEGDARFPPISAEDWVEVARQALPADPDDTAAGTYCVYERRS